MKQQDTRKQQKTRLPTPPSDVDLDSDLGSDFDSDGDWPSELSSEAGPSGTSPTDDDGGDSILDEDDEDVFSEEEDALEDEPSENENDDIDVDDEDDLDLMEAYGAGEPLSDEGLETGSDEMTSEEEDGSEEEQQRAVRKRKRRKDDEEAPYERMPRRPFTPSPTPSEDVDVARLPIKLPGGEIRSVNGTTRIHRPVERTD